MLRNGFVVLVLCGCGGAVQSPLLGDGGTNQGLDSGEGIDATADVSQPDVTTKDVGAKDVAPDAPTLTAKIACGPSLKCDAVTEICCDHVGSGSQWECVTDVSQCNGGSDVPIECSNHEDCVAQGTADYICCANTVQGGSCTQVTDVSCMATCDPNAGQIQIGCSMTDPCPNAGVCKISTCSLPGYPICT